MFLIIIVELGISIYIWYRYIHHTWLEVEEFNNNAATLLFTCNFFFFLLVVFSLLCAHQLADAHMLSDVLSVLNLRTRTSTDLIDKRNRLYRRKERFYGKVCFKAEHKL